MPPSRVLVSVQQHPAGDEPAGDEVEFLGEFVVT